MKSVSVFSLASALSLSSAFTPAPSTMRPHTVLTPASHFRIAPTSTMMAMRAHPLRKSTEPTPVLASAFEKLGQEHPASLPVAAALAMAIMFSPFSAEAAMSGGRMGGSFSAPRSSMSRPMPSRSSYGSGYSQGYRSGSYSRPNVMIAPYASPFYSPFGVSRPYYGGGAGIMTYNRGPSFFDLLLVGGIGLSVLNAVRNASAGIDITDSGSPFSSAWNDGATSALGPGTSVVQVSVALDVSNRDDRNSILSVLDRLAQTSRTDSRVGIQNLTSQVALELLRRRASIVSASTRYKHFNNREKAERDFNSLSIQERGKFEQETVSRYGGVDYASAKGSSSSDNSKATVAVVTLMLAIDGDSTKIPSVASMSDVEEALRTIASDAKVDDCLQSAEILWTPEDRTETLTLRDVVADYPELRAV